MLLLATLLAFLLLAPSAVAQFNATFSYTFPARAPHFNLYETGANEWIDDDKTNYSVSHPRQDRRAVPFPFSVVGENFTFYGDPVTLSSATYEFSTTLQNPLIESVGRLHNTSGSLIAEVTGNWTKLQPRVLNMWAVKQPSTRLTIHNVTVRVPVRTQA